MKVLLIEPDSLLGKIYSSALERDGHTVSLAKGAQQAVAEADADLPDAVVLELLLPLHGGVEFLYEFRSYAEWQRIPIIIHTMADISALAVPPELGVVSILYKPATSLRQLSRAVNDVVPSRR